MYLWVFSGSHRSVEPFRQRDYLSIRQRPFQSTITPHFHQNPHLFYKRSLFTKISTETNDSAPQHTFPAHCHLHPLLTNVSSSSMARSKRPHPHESTYPQLAISNRIHLQSHLSYLSMGRNPCRNPGTNICIDFHYLRLLHNHFFFHVLNIFAPPLFLAQ